MDNHMMQRVSEYMSAQQMAPDGALIIVGVSGGADSMCLLDVLHRMERWELLAVHVHHGLRERADADASYVDQWCGTHHIRLITECVDAAGYAARTGMGIEEAARYLRYKVFRSLAQKAREDGRPCCVAVAHHMEDQAETVLFHMIRGSRMPGLAGMRPVSQMNGVRIIRPLLTSSRAQIEEYLLERAILWREDETNEDTRYARNLLRREIIPLLERINRGTQGHIAALADEAAQTEEYMRTQAENAAAGCTISRTEEEVQISVAALMKEPPLLQRKVLYTVIAKLAGTAKDLQASHIQAVLDMLLSGGNKETDLPGHMKALRRYDHLILRVKDADRGALLTALSSGQIPRAESEYAARILTPQAPLTAIPQKQYTKWLDYDKISSFPQYRTRLPGDRITLSGDGASKKITRYMIDAKVPRELRDIIVLPVSGNEILWIPGGRISAAYRVSESTSTVLELKWMPGSSREDGEEDPK